MATHCIGSAAIIHLVNISKPCSGQQSGIKEQQEKFLADALRTLHEAQKYAFLVSRFLTSLGYLIDKWCKVIPPLVRQAMESAQMVPKICEPTIATLPVSHDGFLTTAKDLAYPTPSPDTTTQPGISDPPLQDFRRTSKHSASDFVKMAPSNSAATQHYFNVTGFHSGPTMAHYSNAQNPQQQDLYWAPFEEAFIALPLTVGDARDPNFPDQQGMSVTDMLGGEYPHLNRDGFMLGPIEDNNWGVDGWDNGGNSLDG